MNRGIGSILIVLGVCAIAWGGITYRTREKIIDVGPIHATREKNHDVPISPIAGGLALIGGVALLTAGGKK